MGVGGERACKEMCRKDDVLQSGLVADHLV